MRPASGRTVFSSTRATSRQRPAARPPGPRSGRRRRRSARWSSGRRARRRPPGRGRSPAAPAARGSAGGVRLAVGSGGAGPVEGDDVEPGLRCARGCAAAAAGARVAEGEPRPGRRRSRHGPTRPLVVPRSPPVPHDPETDSVPPRVKCPHPNGQNGIGGRRRLGWTGAPRARCRFRPRPHPDRHRARLRRGPRGPGCRAGRGLPGRRDGRPARPAAGPHARPRTWSRSGSGRPSTGSASSTPTTRSRRPRAPRRRRRASPPSDARGAGWSS